MATITVEGVPDALVARLRIAAAGSGRSLSSEVIVQLVRSVGCARAPEGAPGAARMSPRCSDGGGCRCVVRRAEAREAGWGGPSR